MKTKKNADKIQQLFIGQVNSRIESEDRWIFTIVQEIQRQQTAFLNLTENKKRTRVRFLKRRLL